MKRISFEECGQLIFVLGLIIYNYYVYVLIFLPALYKIKPSFSIVVQIIFNVKVLLLAIAYYRIITTSPGEPQKLHHMT